MICSWLCDGSGYLPVGDKSSSPGTLPPLLVLRQCCPEIVGVSSIAVVCLLCIYEEVISLFFAILVDATQFPSLPNQSPSHLSVLQTTQIKGALQLYLLIYHYFGRSPTPH